MPRKSKPPAPDTVRALAPAGHTHAGQLLAQPTELVLRREQAERLGFEILGPADTQGAPDA